MPNEQQIGIIGEREPVLCAITGRDVRGKHAVTHYGPDGQYVYVLAQVDHQWPLAAPAYGFPVPEEKPAQAENLFVLDSLNEQIDAQPESQPVSIVPTKKPKSWSTVIPNTENPKESE